MYNLLIELNLPIENFYYSHSNDYFLLDSFKISREMFPVGILYRFFGIREAHG
jgi:hypothetical protein